MKSVSFVIALFIAALGLSGCGPAANTTTNTANTNTNATKPTAAAPTADALLAMDKKANEAWIKGDAKFFEDFLSDKFVEYSDGKRAGKADLAKMISEFKCDVKTWSLDEPQMSRIDDNTYAISYKGTFDGTCTGPDGKSMKIPSPTRGASVYVRDGDKWKGAFHGENPIISAEAAPPTADKKDEAKKEEPKKEEAKKAEAPAANSNSASNTAAAPAPAAADPNTEALTKLHSAGWEAFRNKDAKWFEENLTKDISFVDPAGGWHSGQASVIKIWTADMKCEGITKTSFADSIATALSPTVEILTGKGWADGTCDGQKNGALYQTAVFVKEGTAWKLAFMFESLPRSEK